MLLLSFVIGTCLSTWVRLVASLGYPDVLWVLLSISQQHQPHQHREQQSSISTANKADNHTNHNETTISNTSNDDDPNASKINQRQQLLIS